MSTVSGIKKLFTTFDRLKVMVIGDVMIDKYVYGNVDRISPEAPVPVMEVRSAMARPGGAANVAVNIKALGATPYLFSVTGNDHDAILMDDLLAEHKISNKYLMRADERVTTSKMRIIARQHQMMRIDHEMAQELETETALAFEKNLVQFIRRQKPHIVIIEDYDKGVLSAPLIKTILELCNTLEIPVAVDPKKKNFFAYSGCTLFKPNLRELRDSLDGLPEDLTTRSLNNAVTTLQKMLPHEITLLTLGEFGMYLRHHKKSHKAAAHLRNIADVSGAGDTVISVAALCLAAGADAKTLLEISNLAGGLVCEHAGVTPIDKAQLLQEAIATHK